MERPKQANWMIPLMLLYSVASVGLAVIAIVGMFAVSEERNPMILANGVVIGIVWMVMLVSGVGYLGEKPWAEGLAAGAAKLVLLSAAAILPVLALNAIGLTVLSSGLTKMAAIHFALRQMMDWSWETDQYVLLGVNIADAAVALLCLWFAEHKATREWIAAAQNDAR